MSVRDTGEHVTNDVESRLMFVIGAHDDPRRVFMVRAREHRVTCATVVTPVALGRFVDVSTAGTAPFAFFLANRLPTFQTAHPRTALRLFTMPIEAPFAASRRGYQRANGNADPA